jgi:hypothetical protein
MRAVLAGRALALFRSSITDASGRAIATRVHGALIDCPTRLDGLQSAATQITTSPADHEWRTESLRVHDRMTRVRVQRARAIAASCLDSCEERQAGLFDRRAELEWRDRDNERKDLRTWAQERIARAEGSLIVSESAAELTLVLLPHGRSVPP